MRSYIRLADIRTADYFGPNRRYCADRRVKPDRRSVIRFDRYGGDQRSGFAQRSTDEGFRKEDYSWHIEQSI
jgi:hypothetical protein